MSKKPSLPIPSCRPPCDEGENFYIVVGGEAEAHVRSKVMGEPPIKVQHLGPGASFGELSLMYNSPRAATVTAVTDVSLWALDRRTFRHVVSSGTQRARRMHEGFLERVPILSTLTVRSKLCASDTHQTIHSLLSDCLCLSDCVAKSGKCANWVIRLY